MWHDDCTLLPFQSVNFSLKVNDSHIGFFYLILENVMLDCGKKGHFLHLGMVPFISTTSTRKKNTDRAVTVKYLYWLRQYRGNYSWPNFPQQVLQRPASINIILTLSNNCQLSIKTALPIPQGSILRKQVISNGRWLKGRTPYDSPGR